MIGPANLFHPSLHQISKLAGYSRSKFRSVQLHTKLCCKRTTLLVLPWIWFQFVGEKTFFLLKAAFAVAILDLISHVPHASFSIMLPEYLQYSTLSSCFYAPLVYKFCVMVKMFHVTYSYPCVLSYVCLPQATRTAHIHIVFLVFIFPRTTRILQPLRR
jgi:hypothetical protein